MLSQDDIDSCRAIGIPYLVVSAARGQVCSYAPKPAPLLGRPFFWGLYDCTTLIRDAWTMAAGDPPIVRHPSIREWKDGTFDMPAALAEYGLQPAKEPCPGDVLLFVRNDQRRTQHLELLLEDGCVLSHVTGNISHRRPLTASDLEQANGVFRCESKSISTALSRTCTTVQ